MKNNNRTLYTLLGTQALSLVGTRMTTIALGIWLFQKTGRATDLLLIPFFNELPSLLFGHLIGTVVDKVDRKLSMIIADLGQAVGTFLLFMSIGFDAFELWHLYMIVFVQGLFGALQEPAADASITLLTNPQNRIRVNSIKELTFPAAGMLAPVLAGAFYLMFGILGVIVADLISFLLATLAISFLIIPKPEFTDVGIEFKESLSGSIVKESRAGFRFIYLRKSLLMLVLYFAFINFVINGPLELVIPYILELSGSEILLTSLMALMSVSTGMGALLMSRIRLPKERVMLIFGGMLFTGFGMIAFGLAKSTIEMVIALTVLMLPLPVLNIVFKTILQEKTPADIQGRVFSVVYQFAYGLAPLSFLFVGPLVDNYLEPFMMNGNHGLLSQVWGASPGSGMGLVLSASGGIIVIATLLAMGIQPLRQIESRLKDYN